MQELKARIEAVLFCASEGIELKRLAKICGVGSIGHVKTALLQLQREYQERGAGVQIVQDKEQWKFAVEPGLLDFVKGAALPELEAAVLATLAYIAWKKKIRQSTVVKVRSNKAYDHIKKLEELGLISSERAGSTRTLRPTKRFYDYFKLKKGQAIELIKGTES